MRKLLLFLKLYIHAVRVHRKRKDKTRPKGIPGSAVFLFEDPYRKTGLHGVVAFVLPPKTTPLKYEGDLWGPFGYASEIDLGGLHLYGRDTWGTVDQFQIDANPALKALWRQHHGCTILLAGVRKIYRWHPWPLNQAHKFILVRK